MFDSAIRSERATAREDEAWLLGFPIVALLVLLIVAQTVLMPFAGTSMATGVCQQVSAPEAVYRALMLH